MEVCDSQTHQDDHSDHPREMRGSNERDSPVLTTSFDHNSFLLVNEKEQIMLSGVDEFLQQLGCQRTAKVKVVSIFGNTGDGKSHTLNHTFFNGREVFHTSSQQASCTVGVWASYSPRHRAIFLDTEGLLGVSHNENRRTRLLLKVLAISDVVIYRTCAERLHNDLFTFLGDASDAYWKYFSPELRAASERCQMSVSLSSLGPSVVIFHETQHTELLGEWGGRREAELTHSAGRELTADIVASNSQDLTPTESKNTGPQDVNEGTHEPCNSLASSSRATPESSVAMSAEEMLRIRFGELGRIPKAFSSVEYVGTRTLTPPTDFSGLLQCVSSLLKNNSVRAPRPPAVVMTALQVLNEKFSGDIESTHVSSFPDSYFTCAEKCLVCGTRCELCMNHGKEKVKHKITGVRCRYSHHYDNKIQLCKTCFDRGVESVVVPQTSASTDTGWTGLATYTWSGYVLECANCGVVYRSRQYWYGNKDPEHSVLKTENKHVWPEDIVPAASGSNMARRVLDGVGSVASAVSGVSTTPSKMVASWAADQLAPSYWVPNSKIKECGQCRREFSSSDTKHHCRACGRGFCEQCSSHSMPVPQRGWGNAPVRVCDSCYSLEEGRGCSRNSEETHDDKEEESSTRDAKAGDTTSRGGERVTARYVGEAVQSAVGVVVGTMRYPRDLIVESARPQYWVPDDQITHCHKCRAGLREEGDGAARGRHHCRACGQGFCEQCSQQRVPVPSRGWLHPVRVCDDCANMETL